MIILIDERDSVVAAFAACFEREGVAAVSISASDLGAWVSSSSPAELAAVEAVLVGECRERSCIPKWLSARVNVPMLALTESKSLVETIELFGFGFHDVLAKPVHVKEILVRAGAIQQRKRPGKDVDMVSGIQVFADGRDPVVLGKVLHLPRRERRILEYFVANKGRRLSKTQIFNFVYGIMRDETEECVIESHISKLRKKLRHRMGIDPIDSQRFLGYCLMDENPMEAATSRRVSIPFGGGSAGSKQLVEGIAA